MASPYVVGTPQTLAESSGAGLTFDRPIDLEIGDVLVVWLRCQAADWSSDWGLPSGWSRVGPAFSPSNVSGRVGGWYMHVVVDPGAESSTYYFTAFKNIDRRVGVLALLRGVDLTTIPSGGTSHYLGTTITGGRQAASFSPTDTTGESHLVLFAGASEFGSPNSHVPVTTPAGYTLVTEVVSPSASTAVSRTYSWIGSKESGANSSTGTADITWSVVGGAQAHSISFQGLVESETPPLDSLIGYTVGALTSVPPGDSLIGYAVGTLASTPLGGSLIGYTVGSLTAIPPNDSLIGYAVGTLTSDDPGIRVWDGSGLVPGWPKVWDGFSWV